MNFPRFGIFYRKYTPSGRKPRKFAIRFLGSGPIMACRLTEEPDVSLRNLFPDPPATVGETYWQHLAAAWGFSWRLMAASLACLIHALLPFLFVRTGSRAITELHDRMD